MLSSAETASAAHIGSCRPCFIVTTLLRYKDFHLAAELHSCRTDELIDKPALNSRKRTREICKVASVPEQTQYRRILPNDQAH